MACFMMGWPRFVRCCSNFVCCLRRLSFCWRSFSPFTLRSAASSALCLASLAFSRDFWKGSIFFGFVCFFCCCVFSSSSRSPLSPLSSSLPSSSLFSVVRRLGLLLCASCSSSDSSPRSFVLSSSSFHPTASSSLFESLSIAAFRFRLAPVPASSPSFFMSLRYFRRALDVSRCFRFFRFLNSSRARTCPFFCEKSVRPTAFFDRLWSALCCCRRDKPLPLLPDCCCRR
mmetsp:Transcript_118723/g.242739  ORF Transcript_118723/g.242739 Transcript_118723/m.242739 type:complete len:229 (-) Transcript_118723:44-730(-)